MNNQVTVSVVFSFKGQRHTPRMTLDLDAMLQKTATLPDLYPLLARENGYDLYSYEYEMLQAEPLQFSEARGLVADFIEQGRLDIPAFEQAWQQQQLADALLQIARQHLAVEDFSDHAGLQQALHAAWQLGKKQA